MSELTSSPARLNAGTPLVINGVSKQYGGRTILNDINLHIPSGQFVAVVGRSGCGKSTLLRLKPPAPASYWQAVRR